MFAIVIPPDLSAKKLSEAVALRRNIRDARRRNFPLARRPKRGDMREIVQCIQKETQDLETTDEH